MDPIFRPEQRNDVTNDDIHDLNNLQAPASTPEPENSPMSFNRRGRPMHSSNIVAPDASAYQEALRTLVNAGANIRSCDSNKRQIQVQGAIDSVTLDHLVNDLGCTVTPSGRRPGPIMTTMALGEEGQGWPPGGHFTTQAIPEEGFGRPDEDHQITTQAVGEEGQAR
jgi:hypothetical protein